jgi:hypothetical protein
MMQINARFIVQTEKDQKTLTLTPETTFCIPPIPAKESNPFRKRNFRKRKPSITKKERKKWLSWHSSSVRVKLDSTLAGKLHQCNSFHPLLFFWKRKKWKKNNAKVIKSSNYELFNRNSFNKVEVPQTVSP